MTALNAWWIANSLGPYPSLNFSKDTNYGAKYGANMIQPGSIISADGYSVLGSPKSFSTTDHDKVKSIRKFFDNNFSKQFVDGDAGVTNTETDANLIDAFVNTSFSEAIGGQYANPWGLGFMSGDMFNVFFAEKIIQQFKPELTVVNMQDVDIAHSNFTAYCDNMRKADYSLAHLWNTIQNTPGMMDDTILIAVPEHGRNLATNSLVDNYGRFALDHTGDDTSREIFCLVLGPAAKVYQNQMINTVSGESIDVVPTVANILGFDNDIPAYYKNQMGQSLAAAFK